MSGCKFKKDCVHFQENSFTCQNGGGGHCGCFRMFELELSRKKQRKASQDRVEPFGEAVELWRLNARDQIEVNNILRAELGFKTTESEKLSPPEAKSVVMLAAMKELSNLIETSNIDVV